MILELFSEVLNEWQDEGKQDQLETQEVPFEFGEKNFTECDRALKHDAQRDHPCPEIFKTCLNVVLWNLL